MSLVAERNPDSGTDNFYEPRPKTVPLTIRMPGVLHEELRRAVALQTEIEKQVGEGTISLNDTCVRALRAAIDRLCTQFKVSELPSPDSDEFADLVERAVQAHKRATGEK